MWRLARSGSARNASPLNEVRTLSPIPIPLSSSFTNAPSHSRRLLFLRPFPHPSLARHRTRGQGSSPAGPAPHSSPLCTTNITTTLFVAEWFSLGCLNFPGSWVS